MKHRYFTKTAICLAVLMTLLFQPAQQAQAAAQINCKTGLNGIVCLTIDDGYNRNSIKQALDLLRMKKVQCTFFVIGSRLKAMPDLWRQAVKDGHEICYHSMNHRSVSGWSKAAILYDVKQWNLTAKSVLGPDYKVPKFARLPGGAGHTNARVQAVFASIGYRLIYWSADTYTGVIRLGTSNLKRRITSYVMRAARPNAIILTHFNGYDVPAMAGYIDWLRCHYKLGTVSQAFEKEPAPTPTPDPAIETPAPTDTPAVTEPAAESTQPAYTPDPSLPAEPAATPGPPESPAASLPFL